VCFNSSKKNYEKIRNKTSDQLAFRFTLNLLHNNYIVILSLCLHHRMYNWLECLLQHNYKTLIVQFCYNNRYTLSVTNYSMLHNGSFLSVLEQNILTCKYSHESQIMCIYVLYFLQTGMCLFSNHILYTRPKNWAFGHTPHHYITINLQYCKIFLFCNLYNKAY